MKKVEYKVTGMTCGGCAASVKRVLENHDAVETVTVEHDKNRAYVTYNEQVADDKQLISQIERLGFKAELVE